MQAGVMHAEFFCSIIIKSHVYVLIYFVNSTLLKLNVIFESVYFCQKYIQIADVVKHLVLV